MKLDVKIITVKSRRPLLSQILSDTGLTFDNVVIDDRGENGGGDCWYNAKKAWLSLLPEGTTHRLVLQDDIEVCYDFLSICEKLIEKFPDVIWGLFNGTWIKESVRRNDSPYINVRGCGTSGQAVIIPVEHIKPMIAWSDSVLGETYKHDDGRIGFYALCNDVKLMSVIPALVDHIQVDSCIPHHNRKDRVAKTWVGKDIGYQDWDNTDYNETSLMLNDIWINKNKEPERYARIDAIVTEAKERLRNAK